MATAMAASTCTTRCLTRWHPPPTTCASAAPSGPWACRPWWRCAPAELAATIPPEPDAEYVGAKDRRTIAQWVQAGVKQGNGAALKLSSGEGEQAYLFAPTGSRGPVFLATVNFDAILHYNQSRRYALAVALLLNRLQDRRAWPRRGRPMTLACRARRSRNCRTCCTTSAMTSACRRHPRRQDPRGRARRAGAPQPAAGRPRGQAHLRRGQGLMAAVGRAGAAAEPARPAMTGVGHPGLWRARHGPGRALRASALPTCTPKWPT